MSVELKQSTAAYLVLGPFADSGDALTEETGLAGSMSVQLLKYGAASEVSRNSGTAITHLANGRYRVHLDTTDTNTLGPMRVSVSDSSTHLPVWEWVQVCAANWWDSKYGADNLQVDVVETGSTDAVTGNASFQADVSGLSTFDASSDNVTVSDMTASALAKFYSVDTGEESAASGSVVEGAQGSATAATVQAGLDANGYTPARAAKLDNLDAAVSGISGGAGGPGATSTVVNTTVAGQPEDNVAVWLTTDSAGANWYAGTLYSNAAGDVTFMCDSGIYYIWREKGGRNFTNPQTLTVA